MLVSSCHILSHLPLAWSEQTRSIPSQHGQGRSDCQIGRWASTQGGKQTHGGGPEKGTPKKGRTDKFCKWCKDADGPFITHNTTGCRRFNKDGSQKDRLTKPFDSAKKPWKKPGSGDPTQMAYLTEEMVKLKKRLKKSKKRCKKHAQYSLDSDSDSD